MTAVKKAVKKAVVKSDLTIGTGSPEVVMQTETTPITLNALLVEQEYFEGKKVISSITVDGVRDITVEGGITYRVNV